MANHHGDLDLDTADRLLSGRLDADDAPPEYRAVAQLFHDARREPVPHAGSDETLLAAMVGAIVSNDVAPRTRMLPKILALKVGAVAVVALSASAAAAATGNLPDAAQDGLARAAQHVGINLPSSANDHARDRSEDRGPDADEPAGTPASNAGLDDAGETETDGPAGAKGAATPDPAAPAPLAGVGTDAPPSAAADNHGATVSDTAHQADPAGGKGEEVAPVAQDNHGAEARAEHQPEQPETPAAGDNPNVPDRAGGNGNANANTP